MSIRVALLEYCNTSKIMEWVSRVQGWANGSQPAATPEQMNQGLAGSGLVERVAEKAGVSPQVAEMAMATVLPMVISHFTQGGQAAPPQSGFGGMAAQLQRCFT